MRKQIDIIQWLKDSGIKTTPLDPRAAAKYDRIVRNETIPAILKNERENAKRIAVMRHNEQH